jgi:hypothetical protein
VEENGKTTQTHMQTTVYGFAFVDVALLVATCKNTTLSFFFLTSV